MNDDVTVTGTPTPAPDFTLQFDAQDITEAVRHTAVLANLSICSWSGEKLDKKASAKVRQDANAVGNAVKVVKNLLAGCDGKLKAVRACHAQARSLHYELTLQWIAQPHVERQIGPRLLPNVLWENYMRRMGAIRREERVRLDDFMSDYEKIIANDAMANLADLYDPNDYPPADVLRARFKFDIDFQPIPDGGGFHGLPDGTLRKLADRMVERQERAIRLAMKDVWDRVDKAVGHLIGRLKDPETEFKKNSIEAVQQLIDLLPAFNCANDPRVPELIGHLNEMLIGVDPKGLREDPLIRRDVVTKAEQIVGKLSAWRM